MWRKSRRRFERERRLNNNSPTVTAGRVVSIFLLAFVFFSFPPNIRNNYTDAAIVVKNPSTGSTGNEPAFSLLVTLKFSAAHYKDEFLKDIKPLAEYVQAHEPETLAYRLIVSDKEPLQLMMVERYLNKEESYLRVHKSSAPFIAFRSKLKAMQDQGHVSIAGESYLDSGIGFGDRD